MCSEMNESLQKEQDAHGYKQLTPFVIESQLGRTNTRC